MQNTKVQKMQNAKYKSIKYKVQSTQKISQSLKTLEPDIHFISSYIYIHCLLPLSVFLKSFFSYSLLPIYSNFIHIFKSSNTKTTRNKQKS